MAGNEVRILVTADDRASHTLSGVQTAAVGMAAAVGVAAAQIAGSFAGIARDALSTGVQFNAMKEQAQIAFTTMLGDGQKARQFLGELQDFAAKTPFEFPDLLKAAQRLNAMGFEAEQTLPILTSVGDAIAGLGGDSEVMNRVIIAFGQIQSKGRAMAQEMLQLTEAGIPAWQYLADAIGVSIPEAMKLVEKGAVDAKTTISAVTAGMNSDFGGLMAQQATTWNGLISNVRDNVRIVLGEITGGLFEQLRVNLTNAMRWYEAHRDQVMEVARSIGAVVSAWADAVSDAIEFVLQHWQFFVAAFQTIWEVTGLGTLTRVVQALNEWRDHWQLTANSVIGIVETMVNAIVSGLNAAADKLGDFIEGVFNPIRRAFGQEAIQVLEGGGLGKVALGRMAYSDSGQADAASRGGEVAPVKTATKGLALDFEGLATSLTGGGTAARGLSEEEQALEDQRRESARAIENIQNTFIAEQIKAYYDGGQAQLDAVKKTQESMMVEVQARAAELQQKWGLDFPDALTKAFEMVKSGIDNITESAKKLQESTMSYIQSLGARNVRFANPGVLEAIAGPAGINTSFGAPASNFGSLEQLAAMTGLPSFDGGGYMPYDGLAMLHAGERVLTPAQQQSGAIVINNLTVNAGMGADGATIADTLISEFNKAIRRDGAIFLPGAVMS